LKILFVDQNFDASNIGGAFKSNYAIINEFVKNPEFDVSVLASKMDYYITKKSFLAKPISPVLKAPSKRLNNLLKALGINQYFSIFSILKEVRQFRPDYIIVQRDLTFPAILAGFFKKVPVINIIRDGMGFCPKEIDTKGFKNCSIYLSKKECWECINRWRSVRILLNDKPKGSNKTLLSSLYTVYYKMNYFFTKIYLNMMNYAYINIVASPLMKKLVGKRIKSRRIVIKKITPIDRSNINKNSDKIDKIIINKIENSKNIILFVIPRNEGGSKGYSFVKKLIPLFPEDSLLIVVGTIINELTDYENVINIGKIPTNNLYYLYEKANLTIVPSIYTEAFGRIVIESVINKTPIIVSPQTGANYLFKNKNYVRVLPLRVKLWIEEIKKLLKDPIEISDEEVIFFEKLFSPKECANEIINLIKPKSNRKIKNFQNNHRKN